MTTLIPTLLLLAIAITLLAFGLIAGREKEALHNSGCRHRHKSPTGDK